MIKLNKETQDKLIELNRTKKICLEGNILKVIDPGDNKEFEDYIKESIEKDKESRRRRLEVTRRVQQQNTELVKWTAENQRVNDELKKALAEAEDSNKEMLEAQLDAEKALKEAEKSRFEAEKAGLEAEKARQEAENAKNTAVNDLEVIQKRSQFEMMGNIVKVSLFIVLGVGVTVTLVYLISLFAGFKAEVIGSAWVNVMSILLTNAFSIIGTLMGMKTMTEKEEKKST